MNIRIIALSLILTGCASTTVIPVKDNFPKPPEALMKSPEELRTLPEGPLVLSNVTDTVIQNYRIANSMRIQLLSLQAWMRQQVKLYEDKK